MLEFLNPIDVLYDNNNQHKFKELRKISYVQNLKLQIVKFLNNHGKLDLLNEQSNLKM